MIELDVPGRGVIRLQHLVSDVNGTLAVDGRLIDGAARGLQTLSDRLQLPLLMADTHGRQQIIDQQLGLQAERIPAGGEAEAKAAYVRGLGSESVVALGQGPTTLACWAKPRWESAPWVRKERQWRR